MCICYVTFLLGNYTVFKCNYDERACIGAGKTGSANLLMVGDDRFMELSIGYLQVSRLCGYRRVNCDGTIDNC